MTAINATIFRKYDIRGTATGDNPQLTPEVARLVGRALGTYLPKHFGTERVFVGMDNRLTSPPLKMALIEGLTSTGMNVTDIGQVITPTVYFASASYSNANTGAGVQITGSHLNTTYNGIKMAYGPLALADQQITDLLKIIQDDAFATGQGTVTEDFNMSKKHMETIKQKVHITRPLKVMTAAGPTASGSMFTPMFGTGLLACSA